jgi:plasmid stabilization system protein ParE
MRDLAFEYHSDAVLESWEAYRWYEARSENAAEAFWEELRRARRSVELHPRSWTPYLHGTRCLKLEHFPFALIYVERPDRIVGVAVAHLKRRPGYWRARLAD